MENCIPSNYNGWLQMMLSMKDSSEPDPSNELAAPLTHILAETEKEVSTYFFCSLYVG